MSRSSLKDAPSRRDTGLWLAGGRRAEVSLIVPAAMSSAVSSLSAGPDSGPDSSAHAVSQTKPRFCFELHCRDEGRYVTALSPDGLCSGGYLSIRQTAASHVYPIASMPLRSSGTSTPMGADVFNPMGRWDRSCSV